MGIKYSVEGRNGRTYQGNSVETLLDSVIYKDRMDYRRCPEVYNSVVEEFRAEMIQHGNTLLRYYEKDNEVLPAQTVVFYFQDKIYSEVKARCGTRSTSFGKNGQLMFGNPTPCPPPLMGTKGKNSSFGKKKVKFALFGKKQKKQKKDRRRRQSRK